jgi:hypothetical protein
MGKYFVPSKGAKSWREFLADPEKQWKKGYSAYELANCWENAKNFPSCIEKVFKQSELPLFKDIELLYGFPEYKVPLPGGSSSSQNDLYVLAKANNELLPIMVEGKVSEPFGETVGSWLGHNPSDGKRTRIEFLLKLLGLDKDVVLDIRYQLLHRTVSALLEAKKVNAKNALMLVHSFSETGKWFEDYAEFVNLFDLSRSKDVIVGPIQLDGVDLYFGWVTCEKSPISDENYYIMNITDRSSERIELWSTKRLQFEPKYWMKDMREELKNNLKNIIPVKNGVLHCEFCTQEGGFFDVENVLLYNVGSGAFSSISNHQVIIERSFAKEPFLNSSSQFKHYHRYSYTIEENIEPYWKKNTTIFQWTNLQIPSLKDKPHEYWYYMKRLQTKEKFTSLDVDTYYGIQINIGVPLGKKVNLTGICKPLLDGIISAFHNYKGSDLEEVASRVSTLLNKDQNEISNLLMDEQFSILRAREVVRRFQNGVQWNPADDYCYQIQLKTHYATVTNWTIGGEIYTLKRSAI